MLCKDISARTLTSDGCIITSFDPGDTEGWRRLRIFGDTTFEPDETVILTLRRRSGAGNRSQAALATPHNCSPDQRIFVFNFAAVQPIVLTGRCHDLRAASVWT